MTRFASRLRAALAVLVVTIVAWGALAFGAVYPWAYRPLAWTCAAAGALSLAVTSRGRPPLAALALGLTAIGAAVALQLAPVPASLVQALSPNVVVFSSAPGAESGSRALSIAPPKTALALALFAALALFCCGTARLVSSLGAARVARPIVAFGVVLALVGIVQDALTAGQVHPLVYGFWKPKYETRPFGPFVNPNHFAGWMLMALPLALGGVAAALEAAIASVSGQGRDRRALLGSPQTGMLLLLSGSALVMALSLLLTRSRAGIVAFAAGNLAAAGLLVRRQASVLTRAAVIAGLTMLMVGSLAWAGLDTAVSKFVQADRGRASAVGRLGAWRDTLRIIRDFPLVGTGLNTYGTAMLLYQSDNRAVSFQEAHNDYLQLAAEGGLLVGVPALATVALFVRTVRQRFREAPKVGSTYWLRVGALLGIVSIALQSLVEFSLQMPGNAALFAVLAAIAVHQSPNLSPAARSRSRAPFPVEQGHGASPS